MLQQVGSVAELERLVPKTISPALKTAHVRGFCLRVPWKAIDADFALLEAGLRVAREHGVEYSVRFMAGRHTPARLFEQGCRFYTFGGEGDRVPSPMLADGSPNLAFEREYESLVARLAAWCRRQRVALVHLAWYGRDWAELSHGKELRALEGYSYENWLRAHKRLLDIGLKHAGRGLAVELPLSGHGPLTEAAVALADHVVAKIGPSNPIFFCQANGWGPGGDWGAPTAETEAAFDRVWQRPICRGQQAIQPADYDWGVLFGRLYENRATYCEVYAPSFSMQSPRGTGDGDYAFCRARVPRGAASARGWRGGCQAVRRTQRAERSGGSAAADRIDRRRRRSRRPAVDGPADDFLQRV